MASNTDYTRFTYQQLLEDFQTRLQADERFKNMSSASIYQMFMEMLTSTVDMTNFMIQRTAEEGFIDTARLDSSVIKHAKTLGYSPRRATPAEAEVAIKIKGPLPQGIKAGSTIYFAQTETDLTFNNNRYMLAADYSYTFDETDIMNGQSTTWSKTLLYSRPADSMRYFELGGVKLYSTADTTPISAFQGELKVETIRGGANLRKLGKNYQFYDVDDLEWSNWYGRRDPHAYTRGRYRNEAGYTKVGIGQTEEAAFMSDNLYDIEDLSIYLNDKLKDIEVSSIDGKMKICQITTNSDKTVRIQFGDGTVVDNGLNRVIDNIYIQYLKTKGSAANMVGTTGSVFTTTAKFYATGAGEIIDVTNNIQFLLNSDIVNGTDFESAQSIKNNAPHYYASAGRLITKKDFIAYFNGLTAPVKVANSNAWGQEDIEELGEGGFTTYKYLQNLILYCICANAYIINGKVNGVRNVLDDNDNGFGAFTVFGSGTEYLNHLTDYIKMLYSFESFHKQQYEKNPTKQWQKNVEKIRKDCEDKMIMNSRLYAMPPFVQYFDVCGSVEIDSLAKLQTYKLKVENDVYEWLSNNSAFNNPIYKAEIMKFFTNRSETKAVNLDIKVSELIKGTENCIAYNISNKTFNQIFSLNKNIPGAPTHVADGDYNVINYNVITIPKTDSNGNTLTAESLKNKNIRIKTFCYNSIDRKNKLRNELQFTPYDVAETNENIIISMYGYQQRSQFDKINNYSMFYLYVVSESDFASTTRFSTSNGQSYGLTASQVKRVENDIKAWIRGATVINEAARAIPLPYSIEALEEVTRQETIMRVGAVQNDLATQLTEKSFWQYMVPMIIQKYYGKSYNEIIQEDVNGDMWNNVTNLVIDIYKMMKATFCDSVLDDNNNIVNFSMDNELPVVRLNITYKYRS